MAGFEPAASCSQSRRAHQAALHPVGCRTAYRARNSVPPRTPFEQVRYGVAAGRLAGVAQWQSPSLPSWSCGFDSRRPLQPETPPDADELLAVAVRSADDLVKGVLIGSAVPEVG